MATGEYNTVSVLDGTKPQHAEASVPPQFPHIPLTSKLPMPGTLRFLRDYHGVTSLYHASTVATSLSFLKLGGLASRARVERDRLAQSEQYTDQADKAYSIFDKIFLDPTDLHQRLRRRNKYGPVTFVFDVDVLSAACVQEVRVTWTNPANWHLSSACHSQCWLDTPKRLISFFNPMGWGNHVVLTCDAELLPFQGFLRRVILDDPKRRMPDGTDVFDTARGVLDSGLRTFGVSVESRECNLPGCCCLNEYGSDDVIKREYQPTVR